MATLKLNNRQREGWTEIRTALASMRGTLIVVGLFSFCISVLMLVQPLYMIQLFDRVLTSRSESTLVMLTIIAVGLLIVYGILEAVRGRILVKLGMQLEEKIGDRLFNAMFHANLHQSVGGSALSSMDRVRGFMSSNALTAFFDLPYAPLFLFVLFLLHPVLGIVGLVGTIGVVILGMSVEWLSKPKLKQGASDGRKASMFADMSLRNADVVGALGMLGNIRSRWRRERQAAEDQQVEAANTIMTISGAMKAANVLLQIAILATACFLVLENQVTAGVMFAANILVARIIMPVQQAVVAWRGFVGARDAYETIDDLLRTAPPERERTKLPAPTGRLSVQRLVAGPPHTKLTVLKNISFSLEPGEALGVIGPSGSGKSTLARLLVGVWPPFSGNVRLDGADVHSWDFDELGPHVGYLPQDIELFEGTIAENICRLGDRDDAKIIEAAQKVGLHGIILMQPDGYDTEIKGRGGALSGGQRQRLGLARAVYGDPKLVLLDEPNSNLDGEGETALLKAIDDMKAAGTTVIIIAHNPRMLQSMDKILILRDGAVQAFGKREDVLSRLQVVSGNQQPKASLPPKASAPGAE